MQGRDADLGHGSQTGSQAVPGGSPWCFEWWYHWHPSQLTALVASRLWSWESRDSGARVALLALKCLEAPWPFPPAASGQEEAGSGAADPAVSCHPELWT